RSLSLRGAEADPQRGENRGGLPHRDSFPRPPGPCERASAQGGFLAGRGAGAFPRRRQEEKEVKGRCCAPADYEMLEHTADLRIEVTGEDVAELLARCAGALADLLYDPAPVREAIRRSVRLDEGDRSEEHTSELQSYS